MSDCSRDLSSLSDEHVINRWSFDFYVFKAFGAFRNGDYTAFKHFTDIIESLVVRPMDGRSDVIVKMRFMQFLSRINNGDKLDLTFEEPKTPLESALDVLESICRDMNVPHREQELVRHAVCEMLVIVCIRSGEFEKAEEMLKHLSAAADSAGKKKLFLNLIRRRRSCHSVLQLSSYSEFKQDMLDFIERLYRVPEPFLMQMLKRSGRPELNTSSQEGRHSTRKPSAHTSKQSVAAEDHGGVCLSQQSLRQVYGLLSEQYGVSVPFSQLQQEVEMEVQQESCEPPGPDLHLTLSETQMESLPDGEQRDPPPPCYAGMTISRLVQEDDSQLSGDETQNQEEETQISGASQDQSEGKAQCSSAHPSTRHTRLSRLTHTHNYHSASEAVAQCSSAPGPSRSRPLRRTARDTRQYNRILLSSDPESDDHSPSPPATRHTSRQEQQRDRSGSESEPHCSSSQHSTPVRHTRPSSPPPVSRTTAPDRNRRVSVSSESEPEVHSSSPRAQTNRHSSPHTSRSPGGRHPTKRPRWQDVSGTLEDWSDEESLFSSASVSGQTGKRYGRKMWSLQESEWLKEGVKRFGVGHWEKIRSTFPFSGRTAVNLKDRWRTMVRLRLV